MRCSEGCSRVDLACRCFVRAAIKFGALSTSSETPELQFSVQRHTLSSWYGVLRSPVLLFLLALPWAPAFQLSTTSIPPLFPSFASVRTFLSRLPRVAPPGRPEGTREDQSSPRSSFTRFSSRDRDPSLVFARRSHADDDEALGLRSALPAGLAAGDRLRLGRQPRGGLAHRSSGRPAHRCGPSLPHYGPVGQCSHRARLFLL